MRALSLLIVGILLSPAPPPARARRSQARRARLHHRRRRSRSPLRLGYFPNVTHATAIVGIQKGFFAEALGDNVTLETQAFNAGPMPSRRSSRAPSTPPTSARTRPSTPSRSRTARRSGSSPARRPAALPRRQAGRSTAAADLRARPSPTPQLGNTQDVALRAWLKDQGLTTDAEGGGDVSIMPQANAQTLDAFKAGHIDGAWVPEPWATRLVRRAAARCSSTSATCGPTASS